MAVVQKPCIRLARGANVFKKDTAAKPTVYIKPRPWSQCLTRSDDRGPNAMPEPTTVGSAFYRKPRPRSPGLTTNHGRWTIGVEETATAIHTPYKKQRPWGQHIAIGHGHKPNTLVETTALDPGQLISHDGGADLKSAKRLFRWCLLVGFFTWTLIPVPTFHGTIDCLPASGGEGLEDKSLR